VAREYYQLVLNILCDLICDVISYRASTHDLEIKKFFTPVSI